MRAYGLLPFLAVVKDVPATKAIGWSMLPITLHTLHDAATSTKSPGYKKAAVAVSLALGTCAVALVTGSTLPSDLAAWVILLVLGSVDILSILFPDKMMQMLEYTTTFKQNDYQLRFVTQSIGVHSLCHLSMVWALTKGENPLRAVGYSTFLTAILGTVVCIIQPNMRKSGAPVEPMIPFTAMFAYMAWKLLR